MRSSSAVVCLPLALLLLFGSSVGGATVVCDLIISYGMPCEDSPTQPTEDGWILTMQHVPGNVATGVVLFQHGVLDSAIGINLNAPPNNLIYMLHEAGYDVWLGNSRGNGISMENIHYSSDSANFWAWSWDEMARYDVPTQIDHVLSSTGAHTLSYIGHSQGTTQAFAGFLNYTVAAKVDLFVAMAPVVYIGHCGSLLFQAMSKVPSSIIYDLIGDEEFGLTEAISKFIPGICSLDEKLCEFDLDLVMGPSVNLNQTLLPFYLTYEPNPTSVQDMVHWSQGITSDLFQMYDYGTEGNLQHYGQDTPPAYNVSALPADLPIALFTGGEDYLSDPTDDAVLLSQLPTPPFVKYMPTYAHCDFLWAEDAYTTIYPSILTLVANAKATPKAKGTQ